jgi:hypothetical protein
MYATWTLGHKRPGGGPTLAVRAHRHGCNPHGHYSHSHSTTACSQYLLRGVAAVLVIAPCRSSEPVIATPLYSLRGRHPLWAPLRNRRPYSTASTAVCRWAGVCSKQACVRSEARQSTAWLGMRQQSTCYPSAHLPHCCTRLHLQMAESMTPGGCAAEHAVKHLPCHPMRVANVPNR